jgi:uncharacterized membrane protein YedE/YeeE
MSQTSSQAARAGATERSDRFWNPYVAGVALGLVLLATLLVMGKGLGASGAANRLGVSAVNAVAPAHVDGKAYMARAKSDGNPLDHWIVFMLGGVFLGGITAAYTAGRLKRRVFKGPQISVRTRLILAATGGILMGVAARLARGCTSGQALSGGALLSVGAFVFMFAVFGGAYALAYFVKKEWN